nr:hypothetical protein [Kofleriaceae bacterium]
MIFGQLTNGHTGTHSSWLCPSHMCLGYNQADLGDGPHRFLESTPHARAVHEAGHIVVARWFGFSIKSARVVPEPDDIHSAAADIDYGEPPPDALIRQDWAERIARVCYAGSTATALFYEGEATDKDAIDDFGFAAFTLTKYVTDCRRRTRRNRLLEEAQTDARKLLGHLGEACRQLADVLAVTDHMNEADIHSLIDPLIPSAGRPMPITPT